MAKGRKTGGRQRGTPNKVTMEARTFCTSIVDDPDYQARLRHRGVGGMGEVYRARDMRLGCEVAIKFLPHAFTRDPDRLAHF